MSNDSLGRAESQGRPGGSAWERLGATFRRLEADRPDGPVPPELWAVVGLLALAGLLLLYHTLPLLPDLLRLTFSSDSFQSLGLFFVIVFGEITLLGVILLALAYSLYCGDPSARLIAVVLCGALGVSLLAQDQRAAAEAWVMICSLAVVAVLLLAPATRTWFAGSDQPEPSTVTAARSISTVLAVALGMIGVALLPAASVKAVYALVGLALCAATVVIFRGLGGVRVGDPGARNLVSGMMMGYVVLLLLTRSESSAQTLLIPIGLAAAVIAMLWLPATSQIHFGRDPGDVVAQGPRAALGALGSWWPTTLAPATPAPPRPAPVEPARQAPPTVFHEAVGVAEGSKMARTSGLQLTYDQDSWFPVPAPDERVAGAFLVTMVLYDIDRERDVRVFQGTSTALVTDRRLAGLCPKGKSLAYGALDGDRGPVVAWSVPLDELSAPSVATSASGPYLSLGRFGQDQPWILLAQPRVLDGGTFRPGDIDELAAAIRPRRPPVLAPLPARVAAPVPPRAVPRAPVGVEQPLAGAPRPPSKGSVAITAKHRSRTALRGTTALAGPDVLALLKTAASGIKGGGVSLLTSGLRNIGAQVNLQAETSTELRFSLTSGRQLVDLCTFSASVAPDGSGRTQVRVGGLDTYKTTQEKLYRLIPVGPKKILGMGPYKRLLELAAELIAEADPSAELAIVAAS